MKLGELAERLGGRVLGDAGIDIRSAAPIDEAAEGQITFVANPRYLPKLKDTKASAIIVSPDVQETRLALLVVDNPYLAFARTLTLLFPKQRGAPGVSSLASVASGVTIGKDVIIHPFVCIEKGAVIGDRVELFPGVYIGENCSVGADTVMYPNASVYSGCRIGKKVIIHGGVVIGSDGFGFARDGRTHVKIPQVGSVDIEDDVEIGSNTTIDRATMGRTIVKRGTKIDNLVQIAHNVVVGEDCIIVSQVGVSGSTRIGNNVTLAGQVGLTGHITLGDNVLVGAQSGVGHDVPTGGAVSGTPAFSHREWLRAVTAFQYLPELRKKLFALEKKVKEILQEVKK